MWLNDNGTQGWVGQMMMHLLNRVRNEYLALCRKGAAIQCSDHGVMLHNQHCVTGDPHCRSFPLPAKFVLLYSTCHSTQILGEKTNKAGIFAIFL